MKLYIMRHGETDWNKQGLIQGSADIPLNEYGIALAELTRDGLWADGVRFDKIFTSPYSRAMRTARIIAEPSGVEVEPVDAIREMSFGAYEGIQIRELRTNPAYARINQCFDDPVHYIREGEAESYEEVFARIGGFLEKVILPLEKSCSQALVVCHGAVIRAFLSIIKGLPLEEYWNIHQPNCSINIAEVAEGRIRMLEENRLYYEPKISAGRRFV